MVIGIDKSIKIKDKKHDYIYIFDDDEELDDLLATSYHCVHKDFVKYVDVNLSKYKIDCLKEAKYGEKDWDVLPPIKDHKIAIIVPNFNYEHTIEKCLKSILSQTYKNYEIIFVDDMSTDNSVKIAKSLLKAPHKIIQLKQKRLNGGARNEAYLHISKDVDYIWYVDSDDWLYENTSLEKINKSLRMEPDVLFVGLAKYDGVSTTESTIPKYTDKYEAIKGWSGSSGKVIKKELAIRQECLYPEGTLKEDRTQHFKVCLNMNGFRCLSEPVYVWNQRNMKSVTTIRDEAVWGTSTIRHYADTLQLYLTYKGKDEKMDKILKNRVNKTKNEVLNGGDQQW